MSLKCQVRCQSTEVTWDVFLSPTNPLKSNLTTGVREALSASSLEWSPKALRMKGKESWWRPLYSLDINNLRGLVPLSVTLRGTLFSLPGYIAPPGSRLHGLGGATVFLTGRHPLFSSEHLTVGQSVHPSAFKPRKVLTMATVSLF